MNVQHAITAEQVAMEAIIVAEERAEQAEGLAKSYRDALSAKAKESLVDSKSVATCDNLDMGETTSALESSRLVAERSTASAEKTSSRSCPSTKRQGTGQCHTPFAEIWV